MNQEKYKSVLITQSRHDELKQFCKIKKHTIGGIVDMAIVEFLIKSGFKVNPTITLSESDQK